MQFNSTLFLAFLVIVVYAFYQITPFYRRLLLLLASYTFYWVWSVPFSLLLVFSTLLAYVTTRVIDSKVVNWVRTASLVTSLVVSLGVLCLFKYADFLSDSTYSLFDFRPWPKLNLILPLGISFYTFEAISYIVDVYRGNMRAQKSLLDVALYLTFFPHLVAGPIIRAQELIPQLLCRSKLDWIQIRSGIAQILWGMLKKVYIADPMGRIASEVYAAPDRVSGLGLMLATYAFAVQVYCDFSGYSDIAIGAARLFGIELSINFDKPYLACSIRDFWRRWHISLSTWLRDYLYIPLGGNRLGVVRTYVNLTIAMLLGGLWHGAGWNWVIWGGLQGAMLSIERATGLDANLPASKYGRLFRWLIAFHLVCVSWVFFRAHNVYDATTVLQRIFTFTDGRIPVDFRPLLYLGLLLIAEWWDWKQQWMTWMQKHPTWTRWVVYISALILIFTFAGTSNSEFIYFKF